MLAMMTSFAKVIIRTIVFLVWSVVFFLFLIGPRFFKSHKEKKSISIFTFPMSIDPQYLSQLEDLKDIKLYFHYYQNNDELLAKLRSTESHGYDIVFPTDYVVEQLINEGLIKKIDKSRLFFLDRLNKKFLGLYSDPENDYSIPYLWEIYGIGFNKKFFDGESPDATWSVLFNSDMYELDIGMLNNAREVVAIASVYLCGETEGIDDDRLIQIKKILTRQKENVGMYTDLRSDNLLITQACGISACAANEIWQFENEEDLGFLVPKVGGFLAVDSVCITKLCKNLDIVYKFINCIFQKRTVQHHVDKYAFLPVREGISVRKKACKIVSQVFNSSESFHFFKKFILEGKLNDLWIALKAE